MQPRTTWTALFLIVLAAIAAACWITFRGDPETPNQPDVEELESEASAPPTTAAVAPTGAFETSREEVITAAPTATAPTPEGTLEVTGTMIAIDGKGNEHHETEGEVVLVIWDADTGTHGPTLEVRQGKFHAQLPIGAEISLGSVELDDKEANADDERHVVRAAMEFRVHWSGVTTLHVVDDQSGLDLADVTIASADWSQQDLLHPGKVDPQDCRVSGQPSPVQLSAAKDRLGWTSWQETLWIGAPGYAWGRITIDHQQAVPRRIGLKRGGTLEVRITGQLTTAGSGRGPSQAQLRVYRLKSIPDFEERIQAAIARVALMPDDEFEDEPRPTAAQIRERFEAELPRQSRGDLIAELAPALETPILLEGLEPGRCVVAVEQGDRWDSPVIIGETTAEIQLATTTYATVQVEPPAAHSRVPFAGTLFVPPAWKLSDLSLAFQPMDLAGKTDQDDKNLSLSQMTPDPGRDGLYRWDVGQVAAGKFEVQCNTLDMQWVVDTGPNGRNDAEIVIGEPVDVAVRVVDNATGRAIEERIEVHWNGERPKGVNGGSLGSADWNAADETYEFRAAAGRVQIAAFDRNYTSVGDKVFDVRPNNNEFAIRVRRECGVTLHLRHDDAVIPWESSTQFDLKIRTVESDEQANWGMGSTDDQGMYLTVRAPGAYRVTIPDQPGFAPVPPIEVVIPAGEYVDRVIELEATR